MSILYVGEGVHVPCELPMPTGRHGIVLTERRALLVHMPTQACVHVTTVIAWRYSVVGREEGRRSV